MPTDDASKTSTKDSPGKSLLSKLSLFSPKAKYFTDFTVEPDEPHKLYSPGETVKGSVVVTVLKPIRITHVVVCLHGYVQVFRNPNSPKEGLGSSSGFIRTGRGRRSMEYFGNGFASLFEDEVVLCGEGRLAEGQYKFNFELELPSAGLPSSIDFERGTISYMITGTLTRPTAISPTTTCERKIYLLEDVDVAPLRKPKPRIITLEPISRRSKVKGNAKRLARLAEETGKESLLESGQDGRTSEASSRAENDLEQGSLEASERSSDSRTSSGAIESPTEAARFMVTVADSSVAPKRKNCIKATVELLRAGCLRGDDVPLRIAIEHIKPIKSLHGVIVTLYRQARVDMHPALPLGQVTKGVKPKYEDYYPRSTTGLGGLSLSEAGSSHVFRKDLSQSFSPLIIDPQTLTTEMKASIRVPEEAFPSILGVPGGMVSFRYYIEVVLDLQAKLAGQDKYLPSVGVVNTISPYRAPAAPGRSDTGALNVLSAWGGSIVDTTEIRREKSVVSCLFEITVGTKDSERSERRREKRRAELAQEELGFDLQQVSSPQTTSRKLNESEYAEPGEGYWEHTGQVARRYAYEGRYPSGQDQRAQFGDYPGPSTDASVHLNAPHGLPPEFAAEETGLTEKERARRHEAGLLPSQPPGSLDIVDPILSYEVPSAPFLPTEAGHSPSDFGHDAFAIDALHSNTIDRPMADPSQLGGRERSREVRIPHQGHASLNATDDKQELQRRRLENEASAPSLQGDLLEGDGGEESGLPTAPDASDLTSLVEDDVYGTRPAPSKRHTSAEEGLPQYER